MLKEKSYLTPLGLTAQADPNGTKMPAPLPEHLKTGIPD